MHSRGEQLVHVIHAADDEGSLSQNHAAVGGVPRFWQLTRGLQKISTPQHDGVTIFDVLEDSRLRQSVHSGVRGNAQADLVRSTDRKSVV